ncbi:centromere protein O-like [Liolophura sinensis]|uniref:centromere protein O-like n=1 Tax=Liolophura sinensis TaxID=3198878 RepID=UPI0031596030
MKTVISMGEVDVLEGLDVLEKEIATKSHIRKEKQRSASRLKVLREKCESLRKRKEHLEEKLQSELVMDSEEGIIETVTSVWKSRLDECLKIYRLTGISASSLDETSMLVRFDTSFEGQFHEPYFLELVKTHRMMIRQHTIPAFVPVQWLVERYFPDSLQAFLRLISDHLVAFVRRREDLKRAQELLQIRGYIIGEISYTLAVDVVQFHTERDTLAGPALDVVLRFNDLLHLTPSSASIKAIGEPAEPLEQIEDWQKLLMSGPPSETLHFLCPEREEESADQSEISMSDSESSAHLSQNTVSDW